MASRVGARRGGRECEHRGCYIRTRDSKPFCPEHGRFNGYASRFHELEQIEERGVEAVTIGGSMAQEILGLVIKDGFLGMTDAFEYLGITKLAVACYFSALQSAGLAKIAMDEFGVCLQRLAPDEVPQHPVVGPQPEEVRVPIYLGTVEGKVETPEEPEEKVMAHAANDWDNGITHEEFKRLVDAHGWSRKEIGKHVEIHGSQVGHWYRDNVAPNEENQEALAKLLAKLDDAYDQADQPAPASKPKKKVKRKKKKKAVPEPEPEDPSRVAEEIVEVPVVVTGTDEEEPLLAIAGRRAAGWLRKVASKLEARAVRGRFK